MNINGLSVYPTEMKEKHCTETKPFKPTHDDIEGFCEHALLKSVPDSTRTTAHWLIANSTHVASARDQIAQLRADKAELVEGLRTLHFRFDHMDSEKDV